MHGGTSGIGTTAIQLASAFGARVFATAGTPRNARSAGDSARTRRSTTASEDFVAREGGDRRRGVDVILDMVGGAYIERNLGRWPSTGGWCRSRSCRAAKSTLDLSI